MSDKPVDPAAQSIEQGQRENDSYAGQEGYGVQYEDGQYQPDSAHGSDAVGRSGSFETNNMGGYGTGQTDADGQKHTAESPASPADPEADQGQGGQ